MGYFRKFIKSHSLIARPLSDLLRKDKLFRFEQPERNAFEMLKRALTMAPVLKIFDKDDETELHTDASQEGYGAILLQRSKGDDKFRLVHYWSHKTTPVERNYKSYELEVLVIIGALNKFRVYLLGSSFKLVTDCSAFNQTMSKKEVSAKIWRWAELLENYDYTIAHRPGVRMKHVDALSRAAIMTVITNDILLRIKKAQNDDPEVQSLIKDSPECYDNNDYTMRNGLLYKFKNGDELLVVPESMQTEVIRTAHERGHFATRRTEENIKRDYYIPNLTKKVVRMIVNCIACILANKKEGKQEGFLHPLSKSELPLFTYHIDHMGPLESTSKNYNHILAV